MTPRRKLQNQNARINKQKITFDPTIARDGDLKAYFRVFTQPGTVCHNTALRPMQLANIIRNQTTVHIEGAHTIDDIGRISAGSGIWYAQGDMRNTCLKHETDFNSNNLGESLAVLWAISEEPPQNELTIKTMSSYMIDTVLKHIHKWEPELMVGQYSSKEGVL